MTESFAQLFEESLVHTQMEPGSIVLGTIVEIDDDWVTVNAGLKSESVIPKEQFLDDRGDFDLKIGDEVHVVLDTIEDGFGETRLSREKAKRIEAWKRLEVANENQEIVQGVITSKVKGGFTVEVDGVRAFLPGSLVDVRPIRDTDHLEGKSLDFRVIKLDQKRNNVVVSRRSVLEAENTAEKLALLESLQEGQVVQGIIKNLTDYGAFVDLGGIDGLLHITDLSWRRIKHPSEVVNIGDEVTVKVLKFERDRNRVSLGLKQLGEDPWTLIKSRYPLNSKVTARITNLTDYGCFAQLEEGVEGLVHVSEMDWTNKNVHPSKIVQVGDEVEVMILEIDEERRRISLGIKQCQQNPWEVFAESYGIGDKISGTIKSITDFGIFIGLDGAIDGLVHLSDISWSESPEEVVRKYKKGDSIETVILSIDPERERISLGIKQLNDDPFTGYLANHDTGSIVTGTVKKVDQSMVIVQLADEVEASMSAKDISRDHVDDARSVLHEGDSIEAKIVSVDRKSRSISLSVKAKDIAEEKEALKKLREDDVTSSNTIGDLMKSQIDDGVKE